ncbi:MAG: hypothetical protein JNJ82_15345 [Opitutaceae bacterium]|jgi:hypothetical protein|nr:hypothetical protein [Opitutaceae bacterium]
MKRLFLLFLLICGTASAQSDLVGILYKGRVEYYWVLYHSPNGRHTKISNYNSSIDFFIDTKYLNSIIVDRPIQYQTRVIRINRLFAGVTPAPAAEVTAKR